MPTIEKEPATSQSLLDSKTIVECIDACLKCETACVACADGCLGSKAVGSFATCIRRDLDCADICAATARVLARPFAPDLEVVRAQLQACIKACASCERECRMHDMVHCRVCGDACKRCEDACRGALTALPAALA